MVKSLNKLLFDFDYVVVMYYLLITKKLKMNINHIREQRGNICTREFLARVHDRAYFLNNAFPNICCIWLNIIRFANRHTPAYYSKLPMVPLTYSWARKCLRYMCNNIHNAYRYGCIALWHFSIDSLIIFIIRVRCSLKTKSKKYYIG